MGCFSSNEKEKKVFDIEADDYDYKKEELNKSNSNNDYNIKLNYPLN